MKSHLYISTILVLMIGIQSLAQDTKQMLLRTPGNEINAVIYSPDGENIVAASKNKIFVWHAGSELINLEIKTDHLLIHVLEIDPKANYIVSAGKDKMSGKESKISFWDINTGSLIKSIGNHDKEIRSLTISEDGQKIISGSLDKKIKIWDIDTGEELLIISAPGYVLGLDVDADGRRIASGGSDKATSLWDMNTGNLLKSIKHKDWVRSVEFDPSGKLLVSAGNESDVLLINLEDYSQKKLEKHNGWIYDVSFSGDGKYLVSCSNKQELLIWNVEKGNLFLDLDVSGEGTIIGAIFDPIGKHLVSGSHYENGIRLWDVSNLNISPTYRFKDESDKNPPQIFISSPANITDNRVRYSKDIIDIKGSVIDESGVRRLRINGIETPIRDNGSFLIKLPLSMGDNFVTMEVTDVNDNIALKKFVVQRRDLDGGDYDPKEATNHLFIVGVNNYQYWPKLNNAVNDANDIAGTLMGMYNFEFSNVTLIKDEQATRNNIYKSLRSLIEKVTPNDNLLIYFSGHGFYDELLNEGYWIPVDAKLNNSGDYLSNSDILKIIGSIDSQHTFLVADACFSGSLFNEQKRGYAENVEQFRSRWGLASGRLEVVSDGAIGQNSPFASNFIKFLKENPKDKVTVSELVQFVKIQVAEVSDQTPIGNPLKGAGDEGGEFVFYKKQ